MFRWLKVVLVLVLLPIGLQAQVTITNLGVTAMGTTDVTVSWSTNVASTSQLLFGVGSLVQQTPQDPTLVTSHSITITGLVAGTTYQYAAISANSFGASTQSGTQQFTICSGTGMASLSGTVNNYYEYGNYTITWVNDSGQAVSPTLCGTALQQTFTGNMDGSGSLAQPIPDNLQIVPSPSHWHVTIHGIDNSIGAASNDFTTTGGSINISSLLRAAAVNNLIHVWNDPNTGAFYPPVIAAGVAWGNITGSLSNQTDLQNALNAKLNLSGGTMTGGLIAPNITDSALTAGNCVQASTGGLLSTGTGPCGSVGSIGMTVPSALLSVSPASITSSGTFAITLNSQSANLAFLSPNGSSGTPGFRAVQESDLPATTAFTDVSRVFSAGQTFSGGLTTTGITDTSLTAGRCLIATTGGVITSSSGGCVTSVALTVPSQFSVSGSPVTGAGTLAVTLTNSTGTGGVVLNNSPTINNALNLFTAAGSDQLTLLGMYSPNSTIAGNGVGLEVGTVNGVSNDSAHFGFVFAAEGSAANYATIGLSGADHLLNVFGSGNVGIGYTTDSGDKLHVNGTVTATAVSAGALTATGLTAGRCVQTTTGGLLTVTGSSCGGSSGTVTSVSVTVPAALLSVTPATITTSGTFAITLATQTQNLAFLSPNGGSGTPSFRSIATADLPFTYSGNTTELATATGSFTSGHLVTTDANGNFIDSGSGAYRVIFSVESTSCSLASDPNGNWSCTSNFLWPSSISGSYNVNCTLTYPQPTLYPSGTYQYSRAGQAQVFILVKTAAQFTYVISDDHSGSNGASYLMDCTAISA